MVARRRALARPPAKQHGFGVRALKRTDAPDEQPWRNDLHAQRSRPARGSGEPEAQRLELVAQEPGLRRLAVPSPPSNVMNLPRISKPFCRNGRGRAFKCRIYIQDQ